MLSNTIEIAIIGAGPVGLTMAKLLQQEGLNITVYERDENSEARIWGGTLDLHKGSGQDVMKKIGLLESYYELAKPMGRIVTDSKGQILFSTNPTPENQYDNPEINRNDLKKLLLESLKSETVVWDRKLVELEESDGKWLLNFENKTQATADFIIGANGGMSSIRKYITDAEIENSGTFMIQGEVFQPEVCCPNFYHLCDDKILMSANNGNILVANPKNNNVLSYNAIFRYPEEWIEKNGLNFDDANSVIDFLSNKFSDWGECYQELFRATSFFVGLPTRKISLDNPWKMNRSLPITLIGDAAHLMPPFAGQGVNIGLVDALVLSENLLNPKFETIQEAIEDYEQKMFVYAANAQLETRQNEIEMLNPDFSFMKFID